LNEILWFGMLTACFFSVIGAYRFFGKTGLYIWIALSVVLANIQVVKTIEVFSFTTTLGNILYASSFLATDILSENYGKKSARRGVLIGFFSLTAMTLFMNIALFFKPAPEDFAQVSLQTIFGMMPRIAGASLAAYAVSQLHDVWAYQFWKAKFPSDRSIWIRNNASTMVSQLIDTSVFTFAAFLGIFPLSVVMQIFFTTYVMKWIVSLLDTPFIYWAKKMNNSRTLPSEL
jgi:queuosine precursor transporter